jgi:subtilisin family serine protease
MPEEAPAVGARLLVAAGVGVAVDEVRAALEQLPGVAVVGVVEGGVPNEGSRPRVCPPVVVVQTSDETGWVQVAGLAGTRGWLVEPDLSLVGLGVAPGARGPFAVADPTLLSAGEPERVRIVVTGPDGKPVAGTQVYVHAAWPSFGVTDEAGRAVLTLPSGCLPTVTMVAVQPPAGYWSRLLNTPRLSATEENPVVVQPLASTFTGFPQQPVTGWGAQVLRINQLPPNYRGHGVKIALIGSGIASNHPELAGRLTRGINVAGDPVGWDIDTDGTGTACAGVIAAIDNDKAITGLALDAELHAVKAMPDGTTAALLTALDYCIQQSIDIAQINTCLSGSSQLLAAKLADARTAGVCVIAPAGDTYGTVTVPAALPGVLSVGAIGRLGAFPPDTVHAAHLRSAPALPDGETPATFTPAGPGIDLAAPGVAVLTCAPGGDYAAVDGTAMAAAHITALTALVLAHHDDFRQLYARRGPDRVAYLHQLLTTSCRPAGDPARTGAGIPDAPRALGITSPVYDWETAVLQQLHTDLTRAGLLP